MRSRLFALQGILCKRRVDFFFFFFLLQGFLLVFSARFWAPCAFCGWLCLILLELHGASWMCKLMISINVAPLQALFNVLYPPFSFSSPNTPSMRVLVSSMVSRVSLRRCPFFSVLCSLWSWEGVTSWSSCRFTDSFCQFTCPVEALIGYCHLFYFFFHY